VYLDEAFYYLGEIARAKISGYLMDVAIASSPHLKQEHRARFIRTLENQLRNAGENDIMEDMEPDAGAFDKLRKLMGSKKK
jgi:hypothetical protein